VTHEDVAGGVAVIADVAEVGFLARPGGVPEVGGATETGGDVVAQGVAGEQALLHDEAVSCPLRGENVQVLDELSECLPLQVCGPGLRAGVLAEGGGRQLGHRVFQDDAALAVGPITERRVVGLPVIVEVRRGDEEVGQLYRGEDFGRRQAGGARATRGAATANSVQAVEPRG